MGLISDIFNNDRALFDEGVDRANSGSSSIQVTDILLSEEQLNIIQKGYDAGLSAKVNADAIKNAFEDDD